VFVVFFTLVALALASLLVDVGNAVNEQERAADLAAQEARAAANAIDVGDLRSGTVTIDQTRACADASNLIHAYAAASRVDAAMTGVYQNNRLDPVLFQHLGSRWRLGLCRCGGGSPTARADAE